MQYKQRNFAIFMYQPFPQNSLKDMEIKLVFCLYSKYPYYLKLYQLLLL